LDIFATIEIFGFQTQPLLTRRLAPKSAPRGTERNSSREGGKNKKYANILEFNAILLGEVTEQACADTVMPSK